MSESQRRAQRGSSLITWLAGLLFGGTALGKGIRDGGRDLPGEEHARPSHRTDARLDYWEHERVDLTDHAVAALCARWRRKKERLDGACKLARTDLAFILETAAVVRAKHRAVGFQEPHRDLPLMGYFAYVIVAAAGEFPLNRAAAQIVRLSAVETTLVAATICIIGVMAAHGVGKLARQWSTNGDMPLRRWVMAACCLAIIVLPVAAAVLRHGFLTWSGKSSDPIYSAMLATFNASLLIIASVGSYMVHESDYQMERLWSHWGVLQRRLRQSWQRWNKLSGEYDALRAVTLEKIRGLHAETRALLDEYRRGVAAGRSNGQVPTYFREPLPDELFRPIDPELTAELDAAPLPIDGLLEALDLAAPVHTDPSEPAVEPERVAEPVSASAGPQSAGNGNGTRTARETPTRSSSRINPSREERS